MDLEKNIIFENKDFLIINKPAGLLVHGAPHINEGSLADALVKKYPDIKKVGDDPHRPGILHRLDKSVSGLLVVAKSQKAFDYLKEQFKKRKIKKYYQALVCGQIVKDEDEINFPIKRSSKGYKMAALPKTFKGSVNEEGKTAVTQFWVKKRFVNYTLLKVRIKTGRTHQIRAHLAAYGNPVVGDDLYGTQKTKIKNKKQREKKLIGSEIMLVADELKFKDLDDKEIKFKIKLPEYFKKLAERIK